MEADIRKLARRGHDSDEEPVKKKPKKSYLEEEMAKYAKNRGLQSKKGKKKDESDVLAALNSFRTKLKSTMFAEDEPKESSAMDVDDGDDEKKGAGEEDPGIEVDEPFVLRIRISPGHPVSEGHFGLGLLSTSDEIAGGWDFAPISLSGEGELLEIALPQLPIRPGVYRWTFTLFDCGNILRTMIRGIMKDGRFAWQISSIRRRTSCDSDARLISSFGDESFISWATKANNRL